MNSYCIYNCSSISHFPLASVCSFLIMTFLSFSFHQPVILFIISSAAGSRPSTEKMPWNAESHIHPTSLHHLLNPSYHIPHPECLPLQSILHPKARVTFSKCQSKHVTTYT